MKKITLGFITLLVMCFLLGSCNSSDSNNDDIVSNDDNDDNDDNVKKDVIAEIQQTLNQNDGQVLIAFGDNFEEKENLIHSSELHSDGLIALCTNPFPMDLDNDIVQIWFKKAIKRTDLTAEQQVQIIKIGEFAYTKALLLSANLTAEGLVAICENPSPFNLDDDTVQSWFKEAIKRTNLTAEQQVQIIKIGEFAYTKALLLSANLTAEGLVAIYENPSPFNVDNDTVQGWFKEAIKRTDLTVEQKAQIKEMELF